MKRVEFLYLSQEEILDLNLPLREVVTLVEKGLDEHGRGRIENPPKPRAGIYEIAKKKDGYKKLTLMEKDF